MNTPCLLCGNTTGNTDYKVKEMQLGLQDEFTYARCGNCGTMQLITVPEDFNRYYPNENYYSFNMDAPKTNASFFKKVQAEYLLYGKYPLVGKLLTIGYHLNEQLEWLKLTKAAYDNAILDVGTGNGSLLVKYATLGFQNLTGIDPFINESKTAGKVRILKKSLFEIDGQFDIIMLHHSLEHMFEPLKALKKVYDLLTPGGRALIRIPVMDNYGWNTYGEYWCGLDAPRHIFIPTENSLKQLATGAGFQIDRFYYDSYDYVIWCSEQYKKGIALHDARSWAIRPDQSMFTKRQIRAFRTKMAEENKKMNGDMAALYLRKPN